MLEQGVHSFVISLISKGKPCLLVGKPRVAKAAVDSIRGALDPIIVRDYSIDLYLPPDTPTRPFKFDKQQLTIIRMCNVDEYTVCTQTITGSRTHRASG